MPDFALVDHAPLSPSHCVFCAGNKPPLVDTKVQVRGGPLGRLYVCRFCFESMATLHGYVSPERREQLEQQVDAQDDEIRRLHDEINVLRPLGDAVERYVSR